MKHYDIEISNIIRVLAVAPYSELAALIKERALNYPELKIEVVNGDLQQGVLMAQANFHQDYDIILSRGGTAQLLRENVDLPVVDIPISFLDILKAIQLSSNAGEKRAVIGFESITENVQMINDMLNLNLEIYTLTSPDDVNNLLPALKRKKLDAIICDVVSSKYVMDAGLNAILITSGPDSIDTALQNVLLTARNMNELRLENHFLRSVLREHSGDTVVFNDEDQLYFSSISNKTNTDIIPLLHSLIDEVRSGTARHVWKSMKGILYSIQSTVIAIEGKEYIAFFFTTSRSGPSSRIAGITYMTYREANSRYGSGLFMQTGEIAKLKDTIESFNISPSPILITGEYGTGRSGAAAYIYTHSKYRKKSFIEIDCSMLNDKSCDFLLNSIKSPFYLNGYTIHIMNMDQCSEERLNELINSLNFISVCENNHVIFSGNPENHPFSAHVKYLQDKFQCFTIALKPLREIKDQIPAIINYYLSSLKKNPNDTGCRIDRHAMVILQTYEWPGNYIQLQRILSQATASTTDHMIHDQLIRSLLSQERSLFHSSGTSSESMDYNRPLNEIEKDIILQVLKDNNGNQAAAAKQLQIGRTSLWRVRNKS